ncbi:hypothetical protein D0Z07_4554 [Hyphodiscus hymeniophilus]|uniref:Uncharacterized protein n=1 Tax=Hyphodiscus hymeniophilus TaxID=353542 RepID=A0A9P6VKB0_9HELO|nr:hypothetical protein D0Z07_4554 [Hyphodiscus hymeniophilus]
MTSSHAPLFAPNRRSMDSTEDEETALLGGFATTSSTRPFATSVHPTLYTRGLALILAIPAFILFVVHGPYFAPAIVFLSFAIARQLVVLISHFGSQIVVIHIEVVHHRLKSVSARAQERWIKKSAALAVDGVILLGMLVTLSMVAHNVAIWHYAYSWRPLVTAAVVLGFLVFGLLLISAPDFGYPRSVDLTMVVERPASGQIKFATSVQFGEPEDSENGGESPPNTGKYVQHEDV